jgi:DNA polymerase III epsilon subunit-like protein
VHHLIDEDLAFAPRLGEVLDEFKGADAYVAHNADFERSFLERHLGDAKWVCTYKCALRIWPDLLSHSNQALRYRLGLIDPFNIDRHTLSPHRALSDAIVTAAVFREITKHATWPELVRRVERSGAAQRLPIRQAPRRALRRRAGGLPQVDRRRAERAARGDEGLGAVLARQAGFERAALARPLTDREARGRHGHRLSLRPSGRLAGAVWQAGAYRLAALPGVPHC